MNSRLTMLCSICIAMPSLGIASDDIAGKSAYEAKCGACHASAQFGMLTLFRRDGGRADRESILRSLLPQRPGLSEERIHVVARRGLGNMPPLTRVDVTDQELTEISVFLTSQQIAPSSVP